MVKRYQFLDELNLSEEVFKRVSFNLDRIETGSDEVLISPLANEMSPDLILSGWDTIFQSKLSSINDVLIDLEKSNRSKYGPRSIAVPWSERKSGVLDYYGNDKTRYIKSKPGFSRLRPLSLENAAGYLKNTTNSGLPFMVKKGRVKDLVLSDFSNLLDRKDPALLFTRTQEGNKTRTVWGFPIADTLNEMSFYRPVLDFQSKLSWRAALNTPKDVDIAVTKLILTAMNLDRRLISLDMSAYDASFKLNLQTSSFEYIKQLFQSHFHGELDYIAWRFNTIGLVTPDGILSGPHGVPSGSTFTNEVDSIGQYKVAGEYSGQNPLDLCQIQGDDGAYMVDSPEAFLNHFESYGLSPNKEKSYISDNYLIYLQFLFHIDYMKNGIIGGIYPIYRALLRIVYLERFERFSEEDISGRDYFAIRTISILENCKNHPLFREFVSYIYSIDKYNLAVSDAGLDSFIKLKSKQEGKDVSFSKWTYGDDIKGIKSFETYKLLKELSD